VDCAYAPNKCAQAFRTTGDLSWRCLDASRRAFRKVFSPAPAEVICFEEAHAVSALSAASLTAGDVESRQHVAPSVRSMCVAGPLGNLGQHDANARPDAWQAAALHEGSGSSVRAFFSSVSWRSIALVETSLDLRGTDTVASMAWSALWHDMPRRGPKRLEIENETTHAIGRRRRRV